MGFVNQARNVDTSIHALAAEVYSLSQVLGSMNESLSDQSIAEVVLTRKLTTTDKH